ncbi:MAG: tetratricopeptide repeat protein [Candidatus Omnitrophica bacterium]|nr:tetratricopeptide repeat protein [Candidatus Omnitrophota bacterium]
MLKSKNKIEGGRLRIARRLVLGLLALFFAILIFLVLLPKKPDAIKGVTYDTQYPKVRHYSQIPREVFEEDFKRIKEAGINTIRLYGMPPEFILDLADKYGIKVIETIVFPGDWTDFTSPYQLQALKREAVRNIRRDKNRECIYAWSIWNDAPWTYGTGKGDVIKAYGKDVVNSFLKELYETVKKQDPLRPVTAATLIVDEEAKTLGADFLDILGYNVYLGVSDWRSGMYDPDLAKKTVDELVEISRKYKKPIIITEMGYSTYWTAKLQEDVISDQIAKVNRHILGAILFQWADDWSKAGDINNQDDNVEEHWGLVKGDRKPKGGYYAAKQMFRNTIFRNFLLAISEYCRGTYNAVKRSALRKVWKEDIIVDSDIEKLENQLNLTPSSPAVPDMLEDLAGRLLEKRGFDQLSSYLEEYMSSYPDSEFSGLLHYYAALAGWCKLEHLAHIGSWETYYAEKMRHLSKVVGHMKTARKKTEGAEYYLKVLYLEWLIYNDLLVGQETVALERLEKEIMAHAKSTGNAMPLLTYSELLQEEGEVRLSRRLLREYAANIGQITDAGKVKALLTEKAELALSNGDVERAKILYNIYMNNVIQNLSQEEASFAIMELASSYKRNEVYDEAVNVYQRLIAEFPNSELADDAAYAIGVALKEKRSYSKAIQAFRDFIVNYSESDLAQSAIKETLSIFTVYSQGARAQKTISFLKEMIALYPDSDFSIMARFELASSLASVGAKEEAIREYQHIIDNHPDSDYAKYSRTSIELLR